MYIILLIQIYNTIKVQIKNADNKNLSVNSSGRLIFENNNNKPNIDVVPKEDGFNIYVDGIKMCARKDGSVGNCRIGEPKSSDWILKKESGVYEIISKPKDGDSGKCLTYSYFLSVKKCRNNSDQFFKIDPDMSKEESESQPEESEVDEDIEPEDDGEEEADNGLPEPQIKKPFEDTKEEEHGAKDKPKKINPLKKLKDMLKKPQQKNKEEPKNKPQNKPSQPKKPADKNKEGKPQEPQNIAKPKEQKKKS